MTKTELLLAIFSGKPSEMEENRKGSGTRCNEIPGYGRESLYLYNSTFFWKCNTENCIIRQVFFCSMRLFCVFSQFCPDCPDALRFLFLTLHRCPNSRIRRQKNGPFVNFHEETPHFAGKFGYLISCIFFFLMI